MISSDVEHSVLTEFRKKRIMTVAQLADLLSCSIPTVRKRLRTWGTLTSYNRNGSYYALSEVASFSELGLWKYKGVCFSRNGNFTHTVRHLVSTSPMGLEAAEIGRLTGLSARSFASHLQRISGVVREKHHGRWVYFSVEKNVAGRQKQLRSDAVKQKAAELPSDIEAIAILVDRMRHPDSSYEQTARRVARRGTSVSVEAIETLLAYHGVEKKNCGYAAAKALKHHIGSLMKSVSIGRLFRRAPRLEFASEITCCAKCDAELHLRKTRALTLITLDIGTAAARETILFCPRCDIDYGSEELRRLKPSGARFGYDVLVCVGKAMFLRYRNAKEIKTELRGREVKISESEIFYLAKKFVVYLSLAHRENQAEIKQLLDRNGGYILHFDGTCEGDSPHLMTGMDGITEIVLANAKLASEKAESIIPMLRKIKAMYGNPIALVHDMGKGICKAVEKVFPTIADFICHFHFLSDIGKDLFGEENDTIRKRLSKHGVQGKLHKRLRKLKPMVEANPSLVELLTTSLDKHLPVDDIPDLMSDMACYILEQWALAAKKEGHGYGFPFDRRYLVFYKRLKLLSPVLKRLDKKAVTGKKNHNTPYYKVLRDLIDTMNDVTLRKAAKEMEEKIAVFDKLREAMRVAMPAGRLGLNDRGSKEKISTIEKRVNRFRDWLSNDRTLSQKQCYKDMIAQLDKYWDKLFCSHIIVHTPDGTVLVQP